MASFLAEGRLFAAACLHCVRIVIAEMNRCHSTTNKHLTACGHDSLPPCAIANFDLDTLG